MKRLLILMFTLVLGVAHASETTIRTPDGDFIEKGDSLSKLSKLPGLKSLNSQRVKYNGHWEEAYYYEYKSTEAIYTLTVIGNQISSIQWER